MDGKASLMKKTALDISGKDFIKELYLDYTDLV